MRNLALETATWRDVLKLTLIEFPIVTMIVTSQEKVTSGTVKVRLTACAPIGAGSSNMVCVARVSIGI